MARMETRLKLLINQAIESNPGVVSLQVDVSVLKQDVSVLKQDVSVLKQDVSELKQDVSELKRELAVTNEHVRGLGIAFERWEAKLDAVIEAINHFFESAKKVDRHGDILSKHHDDIEVTQKVLKKHVTNKKIHRTLRDQDSHKDRS